MWRTIAEGKSLDTLQATISDISIPKGTPVRFELELKMPIAKTFDLAGAELIFRGNMPEGVELKDVHSYGSSIVVIEAESDPIWLLALVGFLRVHWMGLGLITIGLAFSLGFLVTSIKVKSPLPVLAEIKSSLVVVAVIIFILIVGILLVRRRA